MANRPFLPSAPGRTLWFIALILGIVGILTHYMHVDQLSTYSYEMLLIGFILLVIGTSMRKM